MNLRRGRRGLGYYSREILQQRSTSCEKGIIATTINCVEKPERTCRKRKYHVSGITKRKENFLLFVLLLVEWIPNGS
jgi:hypothetical protein